MNQLALGLAAKEAGIWQTTASNAEWMDGAWLVCESLRKQPLKTTNADILRAIITKVCGEPSSPNAWGALFTHLEKGGKIIHLGIYTRSTRKAARGRQIPVWRWA